MYQLEELLNSPDKWVEGKPDSIVDHLVYYKRLNDVYARFDAARKAAYAGFDSQRKHILPMRFTDEEVDGIRVPEVATSFYVNTKYSAKMVDREKGYEWLRANGLEELITETVNAGSLAAAMKSRLLEEGMDPPEGVIDLTAYKMMGMSKYTPREA